MSDTPRTDAVLADTKYGDASDRISGLIELCHELERALSKGSNDVPTPDRLLTAREIAADMRDNGLRFNLNPTVEWRDEESLARCYLDYIKRLDARARELGHLLDGALAPLRTRLPASPWIPVNARLPERRYDEDSAPVVVWTEGMEHWVAFYMHDMGYWNSPTGEIQSVTHWLPLPDGPK